MSKIISSFSLTSTYPVFIQFDIQLFLKESGTVLLPALVHALPNSLVSPTSACRNVLILQGLYSKSPPPCILSSPLEPHHGYLRLYHVWLKLREPSPFHGAPQEQSMACSSSFHFPLPPPDHGAWCRWWVRGYLSNE